MSQQKMSLFVCNNINPPDVVFHISAEVSAGTPQTKQLFLASFPQLNTNSESYSELHTITQRKCCRTTVCSGAAISLASHWLWAFHFPGLGLIDVVTCDNLLTVRIIPPSVLYHYEWHPDNNRDDVLKC